METQQRRPQQPGTAFEIRFCDNNVVQVFDLTRRQNPPQLQLLPNEYNEDDVLKGRLRFSKLGHPISLEQPNNARNSIEHNHREQDLQRMPKIGMANNILDDLPLGTALDVIPAVAKRQAEEREREVRQIQEAEKAVQKAMERKAKIEQARMNAKKGVFARPEDATGSMRMNQGNQLSNSNYQEEKGKEDEEKEEDEKEEHLGVAQPNNVTVKEEEENCRSVHTVQAEQATPLSWARKPSLRHEEPRLSEPRLNEPRLNEPRPSEPRLSEPRLSEPRLSEPRLSEPRLNETRPSETRLSEPRLNEPWPSEPAHELYQPLPPPPASRRTYSTKRTSFLQPIAVGPLDNVMDSDYTKQSGNDVYEANERHTSCSCIIC